MRNLLPLTVLILAFGCLTTSVKSMGDLDIGTVTFDHEEKIEGQLSALFEEERYSEALQLMDYYKRLFGSEKLNYPSWEDTALKKMGEQLDQALTKRNYYQALAFYDSLLLLAPSLVQSYDRQNLLYSYLQELLNYRQGAVASMLVTEGKVSLEKLKQEELTFLEEAFLRGKHRKALSLVVEAKRKGGGKPSSESLSFLGESIDMETLLTGTVTIRVDMGYDARTGTPLQSIGSGFFIDLQGYILTNYHVIKSEVDTTYDGYSRLYIELSNGRGERIPARVIGWDEQFDLALLKTEVDAPYVFSFSPQSPFKLGEKVFAIGSPGGLSNTITSGTISALHRPIQTMGEALQIDVPINPGNSGGPLLNEQGEVLGVVFAGIEQFEGINFAVDGEFVKKLLPQLYLGGEVAHPWIGIGGYQDFSYLEALYVMPGSPAALRGIQRGDKILSLGGQSVKSNQEARNQIIGLNPGRVIPLLWESKGKQYQANITLVKRPSPPLEKALRQDDRLNLIPPLYGLQVSAVSRRSYRVDRVYIGGLADASGVRVGTTMRIERWESRPDRGYVGMVASFDGLGNNFSGLPIPFIAPLRSTLFF